MEFCKCSIYGSIQNCTGFNIGTALAIKLLAREKDRLSYAAFLQATFSCDHWPDLRMQRLDNHFIQNYAFSQWSEHTGHLRCDKLSTHIIHPCAGPLVPSHCAGTQPSKPFLGCAGIWNQQIGAYAFLQQVPRIHVQVPRVLQIYRRKTWDSEAALAANRTGCTAAASKKSRRPLGILNAKEETAAWKNSEWKHYNTLMKTLLYKIETLPHILLSSWYNLIQVTLEIFSPDHAHTLFIPVVSLELP